MSALLGIIAVIVNLIGYIPYIRDIYVGKVRPQRITWGLWLILTSVTAVNQVRNGGGWSSLFFITTSVLVLITFLLSLKRGIGGGSKTDFICLGMAGLLLVYWVLTRDSKNSTYIAIAIDAVGLIPTILKTRIDPSSETYIQWVMAAIAGVFTMLSVGRFVVVLLAYPMYIIVGNGAIVLTKYIFDSKRVKAET